ncbi:IclR family transcriptional regulator [Gryllotalpicola reticulitermitis]|uniref:IclR family transcriptional regulator n=1 Tax=Gryllotalpicola reticulitermitis TaxID=1184153 RepID=A0ABV8Q3C1_9MICO
MGLQPEPAAAEHPPDPDGGLFCSARGRTVIQTIDRAVAILNALRDGGQLTAAEIAAELDLPPSTIVNNLKQLQRGGLIQRDKDGGRYRLGAGVLGLARAYLDSSELRLHSSRPLTNLSRSTGLASRAAVPLHESYAIVRHEPRPGSELQLDETGLTAPLAGSAFGKVFACFLAHGASLALPQPAWPEKERVLQTGVAEERYEESAGLAEIVAIVSDNTGSAVAAVGIELPIDEWPASENAITALRRAAQQLSTALGASSWPPAVPASPVRAENEGKRP